MLLNNQVNRENLTISWIAFIVLLVFELFPIPAVAVTVVETEYTGKEVEL